MIPRLELAPPPARQEALLAGDALLVLSTAQVKEGGRRFAAVVAQTWNVSDTVAPTLRHQVSPRGRSAYYLYYKPYLYLTTLPLLHTLLCLYSHSLPHHLLTRSSARAAS